MSRALIIEGLVTNVIHSLMCFEVNKITVSVVIHALQSMEAKLPIKGTTLKIKHNVGVKHPNVIVLTGEDIIEGGSFDACLPLEALNYMDNVKKLKLCPSNIIELHHIHDKLLKTVNTTFVDNLEALVVNVMSVISKSERNNLCLAFVNQLNYYGRSQHNYKCLDYWTLGQHHGNGKLLLGYFFIHPKYGDVYFTDSTRKVPCIIASTQTDIYRYLGTYVLLKDYTVFTEIYNGTMFDTLEYLYVDPNNVILLEMQVSSYKEQQLLRFHDIESSYKRTSFFKIMTKSLPSVDCKDVSECWLEVISENLGRCFLRLGSSYTGIFALLKEEHTYKFCHNLSITKVFNRNIKKIGPQPQFEIPSDGVFIHQQDLSIKSKLMNSEEAHEYSGRDLISFEGVIRKKSFNCPMTKTNPRSLLKTFGTPGEKTHLLKFGNGSKCFNLYLNDWETMAVPYGLIPNMRVIVRNVIRNNNYYKSTALTRVEVVKYESLLRFESVDLKYAFSDWSSEPCFLGSNDPALPYDTVVWGSVTSITILHVKISFTTEISALVLLLASDQVGEMKIFAHDWLAINLLKSIMDFTDNTFEVFFAGLKSLQSFEYSTSTEKDISQNITKKALPNKDQERLGTSLRDMFDLINQVGVVSLDVMCRKTSESTDGPNYTLLNSRK